MDRNQEKLQKLAYVAQRYYLDDWKQSDIAAELGVSRPLVSRMLHEARALGVVKIIVCPPASDANSLLEQLRLSSSIRDGVLVEDGKDDDATNQLLSQGAVQLLWQLRSRHPQRGKRPDRRRHIAGRRAETTGDRTGRKCAGSPVAAPDDRPGRLVLRLRAQRKRFPGDGGLPV